ncbi:helix-turn-helix domain-containing protein [Crassaminicella profunda]|uniref:helix-turn-helix domain-containing protein n=1 Tax=Crassaminicella profunda TaxID=1286698 RepID=UPI001CA63A7F|nr:helix-turn-helix transcriptional regulator [Crassaminicella profunda]QZY56675.1 helix-turn-helix domain-containing protein [Crassaminicella profunda]
MDFGERLKTIREEKKITREELANKLNISYSAVSKYETNVRFPDKETLKKITNFLDVSVDYLLGRTKIKNAHSHENKIQTKAYHHLDNYGLPKEAIQQIEEYIEFIKQKYNPDGTLKKK